MLCLVTEGVRRVLGGSWSLAWWCWAASSVAALIGMAWAPASIFSHFQHFHTLGWALLLAAALWPLARRLMGRPRLRVAAAAAGLLFHGTATATLWYGAAEPPQPPATGAEVAKGVEFDLLWFNMHHTHEAWEALKDHVRADPPDVVALAEAQLVDPLALPGYPHALRSRHDGNLLLSRLPLDDARMHEIAGRRDLLETDVLQGGARLKIFVAHTYHPGVGGVLREFESIGAHLRRAAAGTDSMLLIGDLNQTPWSALFRNLLEAGEMRHACDQRGMRVTWAPRTGMPVGLEIDHLLTGPGVEVLSFEILPWLPGSDHRALRARLRVHPEGDEGALEHGG